MKGETQITTITYKICVPGYIFNYIYMCIAVDDIDIDDDRDRDRDDK